MEKNLIFIELNELNLDLVKAYTRKYATILPSLRKIVEGNLIVTKSEDTYSSLEPWIQWVSIRTGKKLNQHNVFRLGDIENCKFEQIYNVLEKNSLKVGCISPINGLNNLKSPAYFIPDPWVNTSADNSWWSVNLHKALKQAVNDNSKSNLSFHSIYILALGLLYFFQVKNTFKYINYFIGSLTRKGWKKALFLDLFLHDLHLSLLKKYSPNFSSIFFNAGAHIQHHHFYDFGENFFKINKNKYYNEDRINDDPFLDAIILYDSILAEYFSLPNHEVIVATGLTQVPYDNTKYYYRLQNHNKFLNSLGIHYSRVEPRMTRDFTIYFKSIDDCKLAEEKLSSIISTSDGIKIFNSIDNRGEILFVTLTYPKRITERFKIKFEQNEYDFNKSITFIAKKNGMHDPKGFLYVTKSNFLHNNKHPMPVENIFNIILDFYGIKS